MLNLLKPIFKTIFLIYSNYFLRFEKLFNRNFKIDWYYHVDLEKRGDSCVVARESHESHMSQ